MHSVSNPMDEAESVYVGQSRLRERLAQGEGQITVWDVGLGAGANAMAALLAFESVQGKRRGSLRLISFESDLDPLRLALKHQKDFTYLRHAAPNAILRDGRWEGEGIEWQLYVGDFQAEMHKAPKPDIIFYDLFSLNSAPSNWRPEAFKALYEVVSTQDMELFTYSSSTAARAAILSSGFFVGSGVGSGNVSETTIAYTRAEKNGKELLGATWLERWKKSQAKFPLGLAPEQQADFEARILGHPQFRDLRN
jgi:queuine tRNA-ribosyltransferase